MLRVPPLREYSEDVPELLNYYVDKLVDSERLTFRRFSVAAQNRLRNYPWPDNVRELKNLVRRLLLTGSDDDIALEEVEAEISSGAPTDEPLVKQDLLSLPLREAREQFERAYLQQQLVLCGGKVGKLLQKCNRPPGGTRGLLRESGGGESPGYSNSTYSGADSQSGCWA